MWCCLRIPQNWRWNFGHVRRCSAICVWQSLASKWSSEQLANRSQSIGVRDLQHWRKMVATDRRAAENCSELQRQITEQWTEQIGSWNMLNMLSSWQMLPWAVRMSWHTPPGSYIFSTSWFFHAAIWSGHHISILHLYWFWRKIFLLHFIYNI